jgi:excisionase family DNA binding protein
MKTLKQVADIFGVTRQTVLNWVNSDYIKATKIGGHYRVTDEEIERLKAGE